MVLLHHCVWMLHVSLLLKSSHAHLLSSLHQEPSALSQVRCSSRSPAIPITVVHHSVKVRHQHPKRAQTPFHPPTESSSQPHTSPLSDNHSTESSETTQSGKPSYPPLSHLAEAPISMASWRDLRLRCAASAHRSGREDTAGRGCAERQGLSVGLEGRGHLCGGLVRVSPSWWT